MIHHYRAMVDDPLRVLAFRRALGAAVRPGDAVADIGAGLGTFSIFACRAGARRVFAVEEGPIRKVAAQVIAANGCADRVEVIAGRSTEVAVPERSQVVIFEDHISSLLSPTLLAVVADLQARWLAPGGRILPSRARLFVAPVEDVEGHRTIDRFAHLGDRTCGIDLAPTRGQAFATPTARRLSASTLLADPKVALTYDLAAPLSPSLAWESQCTAGRTGLVHGLLLWLGLEIGETWLETGPLSPPSAWSQTLLPFAAPMPVEEGEVLGLRLEWGCFGQLGVWRWSLRGGARTSLEGGPTARPSERLAEGNSLEGVAIEGEDLRAASPAFVPQATAALERARFVLAQVDGKTAVEVIARRMAETFPETLSNQEAAIAYVATVLHQSLGGSAKHS